MAPQNPSTSPPPNTKPTPPPTTPPTTTSSPASSTITLISAGSNDTSASSDDISYTSTLNNHTNHIANALGANIRLSPALTLAIAEDVAAYEAAMALVHFWHEARRHPEKLEAFRMGAKKDTTKNCNGVRTRKSSRGKNNDGDKPLPVSEPKEASNEQGMKPKEAHKKANAKSAGQDAQKGRIPFTMTLRTRVKKTVG